MRILPSLALLGALALLVSTSVPANAFFKIDPLALVEAELAIPLQKLSVADEAIAAAPVRDSYTVVSLAQQLRERYGDRTYSFINNPNGTIQWPFAVSVPIGSGFGDRQVSGCSFCSTHHAGVDFNPGSGAPIQVIADGVVTAVELGRSGLGNHVIIDHVINGQQVQSVYAHMLNGSVKVTVGQVVQVTNEVGQVGSTGASTGPHLHFEIHLGKVAVDPFVWLKKNAN